MVEEWDQMCGGSWEDEHAAKEALREHGMILNPSAVGNPDETPIVQIGPALARLMGRCDAPAASRGDGECGGVNGFHAGDCERAR